MIFLEKATFLHREKYSIHRNVALSGKMELRTYCSLQKKKYPAVDLGFLFLLYQYNNSHDNAGNQNNAAKQNCQKRANADA